METPSKTNLYRKKNPKNKHTKVRLVFDEESRRDYLTGFRKRKLERKKKAKEQIELKEKEDRRIKRQDRRKAMNENLKNIKLPELQIPEDDPEPIVYQHLLHTVTVTGLTTVTQVDLLAEHGSVGENKVDYESDYYDEVTTKTKPDPQELIDADVEEKRRKKKRMSAIKKSLSKKKNQQKANRDKKSQLRKRSGQEKRRSAKASLKRTGRRK